MGPHLPVSPVGLLGVEGTEDEEGNVWLWLWLCHGLSLVPASLPSQPVSPTGNRVSTGLDPSHLISCVRLRAGVIRGSVANCNSRHSVSRAGPFLIIPLGHRIVSQGLVITAALQVSNPEPHTLLGTTVLDALLLGHRAGGPKEKGAGGAGQSRGTLLPAEGVAASP